MPSIFTPIPSEIERKAPGTGGKPPVDRRPTGGGGGGGDDDWANSNRSPREVLHRTRAFVFCALAGDMMFFVVLVTLFYARQAGTHMDPRTLRQIGDWRPVLLPPILFLNTAVLLLSSLTMELARRHIFREIDVLEEWLGLGRPALRRTLPWLGASGVGPDIPGRPICGMETVNRSRIRLRSVGNSGQLLLLPHHRPACGSPAFRHPGVACLPLALSPGSSESKRDSLRSTLRRGSGTPWAWPGWSYLEFWSSGSNGRATTTLTRRAHPVEPATARRTSALRGNQNKSADSSTSTVAPPAIAHHVLKVFRRREHTHR